MAESETIDKVPAIAAAREAERARLAYWKVSQDVHTSANSFEKAIASYPDRKIPRRFKETFETLIETLRESYRECERHPESLRLSSDFNDLIRKKETLKTEYRAKFPKATSQAASSVCTNLTSDCGSDLEDDRMSEAGIRPDLSRSVLEFVERVETQPDVTCTDSEPVYTAPKIDTYTVLSQVSGASGASMKLEPPGTPDRSMHCLLYTSPSPRDS